MAKFEKRQVGDRFKIRDTEANDGNGKWATDGNGRQIRSDDEARTDAKVEELNRRADEAK